MLRQELVRTLASETSKCEEEGRKMMDDCCQALDKTRVKKGKARLTTVLSTSPCRSIGMFENTETSNAP